MIRQRVVDRIRDAAAYGIAVLVAPAGYGKSEALRQCYGDDGAYIIELDDRVGSVEGLLRELTARICRRHLRGLASLLERTPSAAVAEVLVPWVAARLRSADRVIVLDNLHVLKGTSAVMAAVQTLVESTRQSVTWVLSSRETLHLPYGTWIAKQWMHMPLSGTDLAFSREEIATLAELRSVHLSSADLTRLWQDSGGWPVALQLALGNWERSGKQILGKGLTRDALFAYMDEQLWPELAPGQRRLLEFTALLPHVQLSTLEAAGFPAAAAELEALARQFPFIDRTNDDVFRIHDVVRDYINQHHRRAGPWYADAVRRLGEALAERGKSAEALQLFTAIGATDKIVAVLAADGYALIESGERGPVANAVAALRGPLRDEPVAAAVRGWLHALDGSFTSAEADLRRALAGGAPLPLSVAAGQRLALFWLNSGRYREARELALELLSQVPPDGVEAIEIHAALAAIDAETGAKESSLYHAGTAIRHIAALPVERRPRTLSRVAVAYFRAGSLDESERLAVEAANLAGELGLDLMAATAYSVLFAIAESSEPGTARAEAYAAAMRTAAANAGEVFMQVASLERLMYLAIARGDDRAIDQLQAELNAFRHVGLLRDSMQVRVGKVIREIGRASFGQAKRLLESLDEEVLTTADRALRRSLYAIASAADGDAASAGNVLDLLAAGEPEEDLSNRRKASLATIYRGFALWLVGRGTAARRALGAEFGGLTELDRELAAAIRRVCALSRGEATGQLVAEAVRRLVDLGLGGHARFLTSAAGTSHVTVHLTRAELAVLRTWRTGDTITAVAERLGKSTHTVNTHMGSIYRKTGSGTRAEALEFARHHGWLREKSH